MKSNVSFGAVVLKRHRSNEITQAEIEAAKKEFFKRGGVVTVLPSSDLEATDPALFEALNNGKITGLGTPELPVTYKDKGLLRKGISSQMNEIRGRGCL